MTAVIDGDSPREIVARLLSESTLAGVNFLEAHMIRKPDVEPVAPDVVFPVEMQIAYQVVDTGAVFRLQVTVDRPDLRASTVVAVEYRISDVHPFGDAAVAQLFGERVALPAAYPFARSKLLELTWDSGVSPVIINILDMARVGLADGTSDPSSSD